MSSPKKRRLNPEKAESPNCLSVELDLKKIDLQRSKGYAGWCDYGCETYCCIM